MPCLRGTRKKRTILFARNEANQFGSPHLESEHLLLGLLREGKGLTQRFLHSHPLFEYVRLRSQMERRTPAASESAYVGGPPPQPERLGNENNEADHA